MEKIWEFISDEDEKSVIFNSNDIGASSKSMMNNLRHPIWQIYSYNYK